VADLIGNTIDMTKLKKQRVKDRGTVAKHPVFCQILGVSIAGISCVFLALHGYELQAISAAILAGLWAVWFLAFSSAGRCD
jgi:hypothetical protein